jgi:hypothetical protein
MPGTTLGQTGWYQMGEHVCKCVVTPAGEWQVDASSMTTELGWRQMSSKLSGAPMTKWAAIMLLQRGVRIARARRAVHARKVARANQGGDMLPMPGTTLGQTGWYQMGEHVCKCVVTPAGEWQVDASSMTTELGWRRTKSGLDQSGGGGGGGGGSSSSSSGSSRANSRANSSSSAAGGDSADRTRSEVVVEVAGANLEKAAAEKAAAEKAAAEAAAAEKVTAEKVATAEAAADEAAAGNAEGADQTFNLAGGGGGGGGIAKADLKRSASSGRKSLLSGDW